MQDHEHTIVRVDWYTRTCLTAISVLLTVLVIGLWADSPVVPVNQANAAGGYKDQGAKDAVLGGRWGTSSAQGKMAADQAVTNKKLDELMALLRNGDARVQVVSMPQSSVGVPKSVPKTDD